MTSQRAYVQLAVSALLLAGNVGLTFAGSAILTRVLGPAEFGVYALVIAWVTLLTVPAHFGLPTLISRELAAGQARESHGLSAGLIRRSHQFILLTGAVLMVGAAGLGWATGKGTPALLAGLPLILLLPLAAARSAMMRGIGQVLQGQWPENLLRPGLLVVLLGLFWWSGKATTPVEAVGLTTVATAVALIVSLFQWWRLRPAGLKGAAPVYADAAWLKSLWPFALSVGVGIVSVQISVIILGLFRPVAEVGLLRVAAQTAQLAAMGYTAVIMNVSPQIAAASARGDVGGMARAARQGARFSTLFAAPVALVMIIGSGPIMGLLFGPGFEAGGLALAVLAGGHVVNAAFGCGAALLNMTGHERDCLWALAAGLATQVAAALVLCPLFGLTGAAVASMLGVVATNLAMRHLAIYRTGIDPAVWARGGAGHG